MTRPTEIPVDAVDLADFDVVVDVRPIQAGASIEGSVHAPLDGFLEDPGATVDDQGARILTVCDVGMRSAVAVRRLHELGYLNAVSLAGGLDEWRLAGRPVTSTSGLSTAELDQLVAYLLSLDGSAE